MSLVSPLSSIRKLFPSVATKAESILYNDLFKEVAKRDATIDKKIQSLARKNPTPEQQRLIIPKLEAIEKNQPALKIARDNLYTAKLAKTRDPDLADDSARLLLATTPDEAQHAASMIFRHGEHAGQRGIPDNGVYIEGLSSEVPGGGTQLLKLLEQLVPGKAMYLQSTPNPATKEFYLRKGFIPQPDDSRNFFARDFWVKPEDVQIKRTGGHVKKMAGGGALSSIRYLSSNPAWLKSALSGKAMTGNAEEAARAIEFAKRLGTIEERTGPLTPEMAFLLRRNVDKMRLPQEARSLEQSAIEGFAKGGLARVKECSCGR